MNKIEADHFKHYKYPATLEISEKGVLAYTVASVDPAENSYPVNLYVDGSLVLENAEINGFLWSGDTLIINTSPEKEKAASAVFSYDVASGGLAELFRLDKKLKHCAPLSGGRWLLMSRDDLNDLPDEDCIVADEYPFRSDEEGYINKIRRRLYLYDGENLSLLTPEMMGIGRLSVFKDEYAVFSGAEYTGFWDGNEKLFLIDLRSFEIDVLDDDGYMYTGLYAEKDFVIAVRSDKAVFGDYQDEYIDRVSLSDRTVKRLNGDCEMHVQNSIYTNFSFGMEGKCYIPKSSGVYFIATILDRSYICFGDFDTGEITRISGGDMLIEDFRLYNSDVYMLAMERFWGPEIYVLSEGENRRITDFNYHLRGEFSISEPQGFAFVSKDGKAEIYGYVMEPTDFDADKKYPAVLFIHGGPNMAYSDNFYLDTQFLANNGYGILFCNPRGSIGHGGEFADLRYQYYTVDYEDIMQFLDTTISRCPWIDKDRLGVTGGSYGAMMTNWVITHTDRFKAAVSDRGVALEMQDFFMSDIGFEFIKDVYGTTAWEEGGAEIMWENSSVRYAPAAVTPTLFLHSTNDFRCSKEQSIILFSALKYFGVESRLVLIKDENHDYGFDGKPKNRIRRYDEIIKWFDKYLKI